MKRQKSDAGDELARQLIKKSQYLLVVKSSSQNSRKPEFRLKIFGQLDCAFAVC